MLRAVGIGLRVGVGVGSIVGAGTSAGAGIMAVNILSTFFEGSATADWKYLFFLSAGCCASPLVDREVGESSVPANERLRDVVRCMVLMQRYGCERVGCIYRFFWQANGGGHVRVVND